MRAKRLQRCANSAAAALYASFTAVLPCMVGSRINDYGRGLQHRRSRVLNPLTFVPLPAYRAVEPFYLSHCRLSGATGMAPEPLPCVCGIHPAAGVHEMTGRLRTSAPGSGRMPFT